MKSSHSGSYKEDHMDESTIISFEGEEMTLGALLANASRWRRWCSVCLGETVAAVDGVEV